MSVSNFRRRKEEWFRLQTAAMPELQRFLISGGQFGNRCKEILKNGPTAAVILDFRARLANRCKVLPGNAIFRALILDFRPRLGNRCMVLPENAIFRASILDFKARLGNRCKETLKNGPTAAVILDFKARLGNRCKVLPGNAIFRASILDFRPRIGNHCSTIVAALEKGPPAAPSLRQRRMARLQHPRRGGREWPACSTIVETVMNGLCGCGRGIAATKAA